jgi:hypothetical protein
VYQGKRLRKTGHEAELDPNLAETAKFDLIIGN